jgi:hypothetical protein
MTGRRSRVLALASLSLIACSSSTNNPATSSSDDGGNGADVTTGMMDDGGSSNPDGSHTVTQTTQTVGASGGTVSAPGVTLTIPPGALSSDTQISVTTSGAAVPTGYVAVSPVYALSPAGTTFALPVTVQITLTGSGAGASAFLSNASGGYDPVPTTASTATTLLASVTHLGDIFAGEDVRDAAAQADSGSSADTGTSSDTGTSADGTTSADTGTPSDAGASADTGTATDAGTASDTGSTTDAGAPDDSGTVPDSGSTTDAGAPSDSAAPDAGSASDGGSTVDAGLQGIFVTINGATTPTNYIYNVTVTPLQAWLSISADDAPSGAHATMTLFMLNSAGGPYTCANGDYITNVYYTASGDAGTVSQSFSTNATGASCSLTETTAPPIQGGGQAVGTFSGQLRVPTDSGNSPMQTLTAGAYNVIVP